MRFALLCDFKYNIYKCEMFKGRSEEMFIDNTIELDVTCLPRILQSLIDECEKNDNKDTDIMYMSNSDALEVMSKQCLIERQITERQLNLIFRKYCGLR